jgi:hypothetical protein
MTARGRLITPTVITPTVISPTLITPTVITPTVINKYNIGIQLHVVNIEYMITRAETHSD